jgi:hypothetical protein
LPFLSLRLPAFPSFFVLNAFPLDAFFMAQLCNQIILWLKY